YFSQQTSDKDYSYEYVVEVKATDQEYELHVPIVVEDEDNEKSEIMSDLTLQGDGEYDLNKTIHGTSLKIYGKSNITIKSEGDKKIPFAFLNMINNTNENGNRIEENGTVEFWIKINDPHNSIKSVRVSCYINHYGDDYKGSHSFLFCEDSDDNGWTKVDGKIGYERE
ncbi:MAG: hypothetical protein ACLFSM_07875, partial [Thermoplasmata archaeon]